MSPAEARPAPFDLPRLLAGCAGPEPVPALKVGGLALDSREVREGDLFVALAGRRAHGLSHAAEAVRRGCAALAFEPGGGGEALAQAIAGPPRVRVESLAQKLGFIADRFHGGPSHEFAAAVGVTGTNGKTSCSHFLAQALAPRWPGAVVGTLGWGRPGALNPTAHTTPDAIEVHRVLRTLRGQGFEAVAMEASSHGLEQGRLNGVRFRGAVYTNFSRDHLDYHATLEAYLEAKLRLLDWPGLEFVVFNADDPSAGAVLARKPAGMPAIGFALPGGPGLSGPGLSPAYGALRERPSLNSLLVVSQVRHEAAGVAFQAGWEGQSVPVRAPVFGGYNAGNLAATLSTLLALGYGLDEAAEALGGVGAVPGRMERFAGAGRAAVVDYAHTPDALASVLGSLRGLCEGRLWAVFGCGGDRDRGKRPEMGAIAERLADRVVLTDDNPRSEDGDAIVEDILSGCSRGGIVRIRDRREAIAYALAEAGPGDLVLVAGKGHETTQEIQGRKYPLSDRQIVQETLARLEAAP
jgi:UDP-N-acetylmuramoyl-L-alanyl-D-glutamate--2,6-diaminopimelate ligase